MAATNVGVTRLGTHLVKRRVAYEYLELLLCIYHLLEHFESSELQIVCICVYVTSSYFNTLKRLH